MRIAATRPRLPIPMGTMYPTELLPEGLVILPSGIAPGPAGVESGHHSGCAHGTQGDPAAGPSLIPHETVAQLKSGVGPSRETSGRFIQSDEGSDEPFASEPVRTVLPVSSASAWSPRAIRSDTGVTAWRLTPKAIAHLFGSPVQRGHRGAETPSRPAPGSASHEPGGIANSSGRT